MYNLILSGNFNIESVIKDYITYISIFNCTKIDLNDHELNIMINDLKNYINEKVNE